MIHQESAQLALQHTNMLFWHYYPGKHTLEKEQWQDVYNEKETDEKPDRSVNCICGIHTCESP